MLRKNMIISGLVSGALFAVASFATPAVAGQASFKFENAIINLLVDGAVDNESNPQIHKIDYRGVPIRRIHRKMRRRGLFPVSDYRLRGDRVIIRAEDDYGTLFRVVADARYGDILRIRRIRQESRRYRAPQLPNYYDDGYDNYRPGFDRTIRRNDRRHENKRRSRPNKRDAEIRAHAKRKAAKDAAARAHAQRKAANARAHAQRKAARDRADRNRRSKSRQVPIRRPYIDSAAKRYKEQQYGGGK